MSYQQPPDHWADDQQTETLTRVGDEPQPAYPGAGASVPGGNGLSSQPGFGRHRRPAGPDDDTAHMPGPPPPSSFHQTPEQALPDPRWSPVRLSSEDYTPAPGALQNAPPPHRRRPRVSSILIASAAGLVLLLTGTAIGTARSSTSKPAPTSTVTVTAAAAPAATVTVTRTATPRAAAAASAQAAPTSPATSAAAPIPASSVLVSLSGNGIQNSAPFVVNSSSVTAHYTYNCSAFGESGNFIASIIGGSPSNGTYDDETIANVIGTGGSRTTTVYPQNQGSSYHLAVNSECSWSITLTAG